jgi:septum formation protein
MKIKRIILGSQSPRRREYIQYLGYPVIAMKPDVEESYPSTLALQAVPTYLAELKAGALNVELQDGDILLTSDTVVIIDNQILGKPNDEADAIKLLQQLSGRTHEVVSGVHLKSMNKEKTISVSTKVTFADLSLEEIMNYVKISQPLDKAGAYGIQESIGFVGVKSIEGSYMNVIGLPLAQIREALMNW